MPRWIDLHYENHALMHGDRQTVGQGYWGVIRLMRIGQYSQYWNEQRQEAIGGSKWLYDDYLLRFIDMPAASLLSLPRLRSNESDIVYAGLENINSQIFAAEAVPSPPLKKLRRMVQNDDLIYTIDKHESRDVPSPPFQAVDRYNINGVLPVKGDCGRVEIIYMTASRIHGEG